MEEGDYPVNSEVAASPSRYLIRSLLVVLGTNVYAIIFFVSVFFWMVNRQTHFRDTKGSSITHKSISVSHKVDDDEETEETSEEEGEKDGGEDDGRNDVKISRRRKQSKSLTRKQMSSLNALNRFGTEMDEEDLELQTDDEFDDDKVEMEHDKPSSERNRSVMGLVKKIKVFSYLNEEALKLCLEYVEFVNVPRGEYLFEQDKFDGSLFAVVSGRVRCRFHDFVLPEDEPRDEDDDGLGLLGFSSGPGSVVTPLLAMLAALVQDQKDDSKKTLSIGLGVSAVATAPNTRLIRVPPRCFSAVLEKFPAEVHRIAQTIVCRIQRVTVQTLVKMLGLRSELLRWKTGKTTSSEYTKDNGWQSSLEWRRLSSALEENEGNAEEILASVKNDAAVVAATQFGVPSEGRTESVELLREHCSVVHVAEGEVLIEAGVTHNAVYLLLHGAMEVGLSMPTGQSSPFGSSSHFHRLYNALPGTFVGTLSCFTGEVALFTARCPRGSSERAGGDGCTLLKVPRRTFEELIVRHPRAMTRCVEFFLGLASPVIHLLNWNSEWMHVKAAEEVARQGDQCDSLFVVLNGRLRASYRRGSSSSPGVSSSERRFEECGRGKCIGEVGGLTRSPWPCDVYAIRNSEVAKVPIRTLVAIIRAFPAAGLNFARMIASQVQSTYNEGPKIVVPPDSAGLSRGKPSSFMPSYGLTLATIAVVPLTPDIDLSDFCTTLVSALGQIAPATQVTKSLARQALGERIYRHRNAMHDLRMTRFLADLEENNRLVVYQADLKYTWWTRLCIQQADLILLTVHADKAPEKNRIEQSLAWAFDSMDVRIQLVVVGQAVQNDREHLDDDNYEEDEELNVSDQLNNWSEDRPWIKGHHLVRVPFARHKLDFRRMSRRVTGRSVGLVLGGGGARGIAHLGVIRALKEAGITIDMVGGTSQGAFIGALYAKNPDNLEGLMNSSREMADKLSSVKEKLLDLTLPMTSIFSGRRFNNGIRTQFGKIRIQDLVLNFFCMTTDIQKRKQIVHTKGLLWKYVRASMSLTGYLPPIAENGSLLVDGGYINVVPVDVMRHQMGARTVIAVDVSAEIERDYYDYGMHLSGWWLLWNSWNPFVKTVKVPSMGDISDTLRWVSADQHRMSIVDATDLHLTPPIQQYGTLEYDKFDEIVEKAYEHAKPLVDDWVRQNPWLVSEKLRA